MTEPQPTATEEARREAARRRAAAQSEYLYWERIADMPRQQRLIKECLDVKRASD